MPTDIHTADKTFDTLIIGGGFAGLSAAIWLGRYHRSVAIIGQGPPRNNDSSVVHGYPGSDGCRPDELLSRMRQEAAGYGAFFIDDWAGSAAREEDNFAITGRAGTYRGHTLLLATGTADTRPEEIPGFTQFLGRTIWHCPACDGHEYSDKQIAIIGWHKDIIGYAEEFLTYTAARNITVYTHGHATRLGIDIRRTADDDRIRIIDECIDSLRGDGGQLREVVTADQVVRPADALFYNIAQHARLELAEGLGCDLTDGAVQVNQQQETSVPGVFAAGDITPFDDLVVVACSTGAVAASSIHEQLRQTDTVRSV